MKVSIIIHMITVILLLLSCESKDVDINFEYDLLYNDLKNYNTYGYKSYYSRKNLKAQNIINLEQGALFLSEKLIDLAIVGDGYFKFKNAENEYVYSRNGRLHINQYGMLVNDYDYAIIPELIFDESIVLISIKITQDGKLFIKSSETSNEDYIYQFKLYKLSVENGIKYNKSNLIYLNSNEEVIEEGNPGYNGFGTTIQGCLEQSNVNPKSILIRLLFLLNNKNIGETIKCIETKKELINNVLQQYELYYQLDLFGSKILKMEKNIFEKNNQEIDANDNLIPVFRGLSLRKNYDKVFDSFNVNILLEDILPYLDRLYE